jgi:hypothetical protein
VQAEPTGYAPVRKTLLASLRSEKIIYLILYLLNKKGETRTHLKKRGVTEKP